MEEKKTILVTGGAGFIGSELIRYLVSKTNHKVINVDKLTYSGNLLSLESIEKNKNYCVIKTKIQKFINRIKKFIIYKNKDGSHNVGDDGNFSI